MRNVSRTRLFPAHWPVILALLAAALLGGYASATESHHVRSYVTKRGAYVAPHRQTNPDHSKLNNWSTKGNVNPYTGKKGTKVPH
jgi:hypothetical protein